MDGTMSSAKSAAPLDCTLSDYDHLDGYASVKEIASEQRRSSQLFKLIDGGMNLPSLTVPILATPTLDHFVGADCGAHTNCGWKK